jgi:hypothetical protein
MTSALTDEPRSRVESREEGSSSPPTRGGKARELRALEVTELKQDEFDRELALVAEKLRILRGILPETLDELRSCTAIRGWASRRACASPAWVRRKLPTQQGAP